MAYQLKIDKLQFKFSKNQTCLFYNITCVLESGNLYLLTGKNGSGKSTLLRILQGTLHDHEILTGTITVDTTVINLEKNYCSLANYVTLVQQDYDSMLIDVFTAEQNLQLAAVGRFPALAPLPAYKLPPDLLEHFEIPLTIPVNCLSGGQRQFISLLAALQKPVKVLLLDEPTAALDKQNKCLVMKLLNDLAEKKDLIIIMICHDDELIKNYNKDRLLDLSTLDRSSLIEHG